MAFFGVTVETIATVKPVENSDRLDVCTLEGMGFEFVVGRDQWKPGDKCLYFPIDSLIPEDVQEKLGVKGYLSGPKKNRVKTIRLRGQVSQGLVGPLDILDTLDPSEVEAMPSEELTALLRVEKYEPPERISGLGGGRSVRMATLPPGQTVYDIEGAQRYKSALDRLLEIPVLITEKLEGSNWSATRFLQDGEWKTSINTRRHAIIPKDDEEEHPFIKAYTEQGFESILEAVQAKYPEASMIVLYGEFCGPGVQKNIYDLQSHKVYLFDIKVDNRFLDVEDFLCLKGTADIVPIISKGDTLSKVLESYIQQGDQPIDALKKASTGKSILKMDALREGIVIRPLIEEYSPALHGRLIIKQRSPEYLAKSKL
ncbi:MAG: hypothetical protein DRN26_00060 [Thermoplasmata archaeon]|nr:MAG: hypothetical protein DRN26_00060 [Thermoplasmata archaeon]